VIHAVLLAATLVAAAGASASGGGAGETTSTAAAGGWTSWHEYQGRCLELRLGTRQMLDVTAFSQDATSVGQLGTIEPAFEWREARFSADGRLRCFAEPWVYSVAVDFNGFDLPSGQRFGLSDFWVEVPLHRWVGHLVIGVQKQPFSLEELVSGADLVFMERALAPFQVGDWPGLVLANDAFDGRLTWAAGVFAQSSGETAGAARVTGLPVYEGQAALLQVGLGGRYLSFPGGAAHYKGRPATHVGPYWVDTGKFTAGGAWQLDAQLLGIWGPLSLQAELIRTWTLSSEAGDPALAGGYVQASWFPTGEALRFSRAHADHGAVLPIRPWGAVELAARWYRTDLDGGSLHGGKLNGLQLGASWYLLEAMFRLEVNYGRVWLERYGVTGHGGVWGFRLQFQI
jgi:phosphate-selective porin